MPALNAERIEREPSFGGSEPDFLARLHDGRDALVEVRVVTPATEMRLNRTIIQLRSYGQAYLRAGGAHPPILVLVVSGAIAPGHITRLEKSGIDRVIDGPMLRAAAPNLPWPDTIAQGKLIGAPYSNSSDSSEHPLIRELEAIKPGRADWFAYQTVVRDILAATLSPPLSQPLDELSNETGVNRRDIVLPNYASDGLWKFLRDHYEAHYIVVEAKNLGGGVKKGHVLQIGNYLSAHGTGLFGIVICRNATDRSAEVTRREQWVIYRKLIIVLNDEDLKQMLTHAAAGLDPAVVIRQKIEDFRLGF